MIRQNPEEKTRNAKSQYIKELGGGSTPAARNFLDYRQHRKSEKELKVRGLSRLIDILCIILSLPMQTTYGDPAFQWILKVQRMFHTRSTITSVSISSIDSLYESLRELVYLNAEIWIYLSQYKLDEIRMITVFGNQLLDILPSLSESGTGVHGFGSEEEKAAEHDETERIQVVPQEVLDLAVDLALVQINTCFTFQRTWEVFMKVVAILGEGGNKVLKALTRDPAVMQMFDAVIFVTVSGNWTVHDMEKDIAQQVGLITGNTVNPGSMLHNILRNRNFLLCVDDTHEKIDLLEWVTSTHLIRRSNHSKVVFANESQRISQLTCGVELLKIRMEDHLVPWFSFCKNVGQIINQASSPIIQYVAASLVKRCGGHLLATILLARSLRGIADTNTWQSALHSVNSTKPSPMTNKDKSNNAVLVINVLKFVLEHKGYLTRRCFIASAPFEPNTRKLGNINSIIHNWMSNAVIDTEEEGERIMSDLIRSFLLLHVGERGKDVRRMYTGRALVHDKGKGVIPSLSIYPSEFQRPEFDVWIMEDVCNVVLRNSSELNTLFLHGDGIESLKDGWSNAIQIHLMNDDVTDLPESLNRPNLKKLFLQMNSNLTLIPTSFFELMPNLQELDLSNTSIKSLPQSFFKLATLKKLFLRSCEVFTELPSQIGELQNLLVLDLEGTDIMCLPVEISNLIKLTCLKVSFCESMSDSREETMVPEGALSKLSQLIELHIDVDPEDERWEGIVKRVMKELVHLKQLKSLQMYLPEIKVLDELIANVPSLLHDTAAKFSLNVGSHMRRIMFQTPLEVECKLESWKRCLKYVNGKGSIPSQVVNVLKYADAFILDRHFTVTKLSEFGVQNMENVRVCILGECNELHTTIEASDVNIYEGNHGDGDGDLHYSENPILPKLQHFIIYNMKKLRSFLKGPLCYGSLSCLKTLTLQGCPQLRIIFTLGSVVALTHLEELTVEDCPAVLSLITWNNQSTIGFLDLQTRQFINNLKKISLHYLPELESISSGLHIAPGMERISVYNCPKLMNLSSKEISCPDNLKVIRGENNWWNTLKWNKPEWTEGRPENLARVFVPIRCDTDLGTQLAADGPGQGIGCEIPTYPSSKHRRVDWVRLEAPPQVEKEEKEEKLDGSKALLKLYRETSLEKLFTNWKELAARLEGSPLDGVGPERLTYSSSKPRRVDWNRLKAIVKEEEREEKLVDGDAALNKYLRELYQDADEDTRAAMIKSFEMSTDWKEVSRKMEGGPHGTGVGSKRLASPSSKPPRIDSDKVKAQLKEEKEAKVDGDATLSKEKEAKLDGDATLSKKVVLKVNFRDNKDSSKAIKAVAILPGVNSVAMDTKDQKMTIVGNVDAVLVAKTLRKRWQAEIISVSACPAKEREKKEEFTNLILDMEIEPR